jgi:3-hydroxyacyl-CoA dehydrogenase/3a,7a,12a-trihydroxy-5b-cholest-24-enoyl-CoA hydratase
VAIVTGAGKGIGREIAMALGSRGASVVVNNRSRDGADPASDVVAEIKRAGGVAVAERSSVEAPGAAGEIVAAALDNFGRLDHVVANAAIVDRATFANADPNRFRQVIEIDFMAPVALARAALAEVQKRSGRFLFMTSTAGAYGELGASSYAAAKGALNAFAKTLALEHARDGVKVNLLAPYALTQMTEGFVTDEQAQALSPDRVVPAAIWLLGPDVPVTGATIVAAANTFRPLATGEATGVAFSTNTTVTDDRFAQAANEVLDLDGWISHPDGITAFRHLMASTAENRDQR